MTVILGDPEAEPLWHARQWKAVEESLGQLLRSHRGPTAVRCHQIDPNTRDYIRFGRLGWNSKGHKKWIHDLDIDAGRESWVFGSVEAWAPGWTVCERERRPPDVYLAFWNQEASSAYSRSAAFNPCVVLAVGADRATDHERRDAIRIMAAATGSLLIASKQRTWGISASPTSRSFSRCIQDWPSVGLFRTGPRHDQAPGLDLFAEKGWEHHDLEELVSVQ